MAGMTTNVIIIDLTGLTAAQIPRVEQQIRGAIGDVLNYILRPDRHGWLTYGTLPIDTPPTGTNTTELEREQARLSMAVDAFAAAMKDTLFAKARAGHRGGLDPENSVRVRQLLEQHIGRGPGQAVDCANLAMMLWWHLHGAEECHAPL